MLSSTTSTTLRRGAAIAFVALLLAAPAAAEKKKGESKDERPPVPDLVWPLPPEKPRIKYLGALSTSEDVAPVKKKGWFKKLIDEEQAQQIVGLTKPSGVAVDSRDRVYVTDSAVGAVFVFDPANKKLELLGAKGQGRLSAPFGIAIDRQDRIYVADTGLKRVNIYAPTGELAGVISRIGDETLVNPTGVAVDDVNRRLLIVDSRAHRVVAVNLDAWDTGVWFSGNEESGTFYYPTFVATDAAGRVYISDTLNFCVRVFDKDFKFIRRIGEHGTSLGNFDRPKGVALDSEGHLYVVDAAFSNFQIFDDQGRLLLYVGSFGLQPGAFRLPSGICIDKRNRVFVVDSINARVQMVQFLGTQ